MGGPGADSSAVTQTNRDGYTTYNPGDGVHITSGAGQTYTVSCRGSNEECFAEAQRKCPHGYETVHGPSTVAGPPRGLFSGQHDDDDDDGLDLEPIEVNEMRVTCNAPGDSEGITESIRAKELADQPNKMPPRTPPPDGAAGFAFDQTPTEVREACQSAGHTWGTRTCTGVARNVGVPAEARFGFCGGRVCMIVAEAKLAPDDGAGYKHALTEVRKALVAKYGEANAKKVRWPAGCQEAHEIMGCLDRATAHFRYEWAWDSGHGIVFVLGKKQGNPPVLRVTYSSPASREARAPAGL